MQFIITILLCMFFVGLFTGHTGAAFIAFCAASFFVWADAKMDEEKYREDDDPITDDDIDPRIKS